MSTDPAAPIASPVAAAMLETEMSPDQARERIEVLKGDPEFTSRLGKSDVAARDHWLRLWERVRGELPPPASVENTYAQQEQRVAAEAETHGNFLRARGLTDIEIHQIQGGRPVPIEEKRFFEAKWEQLKNDRAWYQRWLNGDAEAVAEQSGSHMRLGCGSARCSNVNFGIRNTLFPLPGKSDV